MIGPFQVNGPSLDSVTLTAAFSGNTTSVFKVGREMEQIVLYVTYTPKSAQSNRYLLIRAEFGPTNDDLYQITKLEDTSTDSETLNRAYDIRFPSSTGSVGGTEYKGRIAVPVADTFGRFSLKESGSSNFGIASLKMKITSRS